jgi:hypothetical protein
MNDKSVRPQKELESVKALVLRTLEGKVQKARFVTELAATLARSGIAQDTLEAVLGDLADTGIVIVRDHFCADPHLSGVDLRIAAVVRPDVGAAPELDAIRRIDEAWNRWLAEYLANHRCG